MPFFVTKVLGTLLLPTHIAALLIAIGLALTFARRRAALGRGLALTGFALLLALGFGPVGNALIHPLEQRFAGSAPPAANERLAGIILLGGFESGGVSASRPGLALTEAGERLTEGVRIALRHPEAKVVFTGGPATLTGAGVSGAAPVAAYLKDVGIAQDRIVLEGRSRTTYENALFTRELVKPKPGDRWLLVTSAAHMPRSVGVFRKAGFDVLPYPVDYRTGADGDLTEVQGKLADGLQRVDTAAKEWLGLLAYWLMGRTSALWPGP
jgi:uncharacterized SAM-binding protein YcdF (DUF218 family)